MAGMRSRAAFERLVELHLDRLEFGVAFKIKSAIGIGWPMMIDHLYQKHASGTDAAISFAALDECAAVLIRLSNSEEVDTYVGSKLRQRSPHRPSFSGP